MTKQYYIEVKHSDRPTNLFEAGDNETESDTQFIRECANFGRYRGMLGGTTVVTLFRKVREPRLNSDAEEHLFVLKRVRIEMDFFNNTPIVTQVLADLKKNGGGDGS